METGRVILFSLSNTEDCGRDSGTNGDTADMPGPKLSRSSLSLISLIVAATDDGLHSDSGILDQPLLPSILMPDSRWEFRIAVLDRRCHGLLPENL